MFRALPLQICTQFYFFAATSKIVQSGQLYISRAISLVHSIFITLGQLHYKLLPYIDLSRAYLCYVCL